MSREAMGVARAKQVVESGYDACAEAYDRARASVPPAELRRFCTRLSPGQAVLDIGCGTGDSVLATLPAGCDYTGVDLSARQIEIARPRHPGRSFVHADIMELDFEARSVDAIVALYALFHLPVPEQMELIRRASRWLRAGGYLFASLSDEQNEGYTEPDFFGVTMFWAHQALAEFLKVLRETGFEILETGALGHGYQASRPEERHSYVVARRGD